MGMKQRKSWMITSLWLMLILKLDIDHVILMNGNDTMKVVDDYKPVVRSPRKCHATNKDEFATSAKS
uniref:Transmembrane protein n=1 Tax=Acrobeloides nanus TaxID=290746 RepID=A0A914CY25_9BILA